MPPHAQKSVSWLTYYQWIRKSIRRVKKYTQNQASTFGVKARVAWPACIACGQASYTATLSEYATLPTGGAGA
jgi:hypothetical protein